MSSAYEQQQKQLDSLLDVDDYSPDVKVSNPNLDFNEGPNYQTQKSNNNLWDHDDIKIVNKPQDKPTSQQNLWNDSQFQPAQVNQFQYQQPQQDYKPTRKSNNDLWGSDDDIKTQEIDPNSANYRQQLKKKVQDEIDQRAQNKIAKDELDPKLTAWAFKDGARQNLRNLLSTMNTVLWEGAKWNCSISDLLSDGKVKVYKINKQAKYMQAIRLTHPDKNKQSEPKQRYTAERVFFELNQAWNATK